MTREVSVAPRSQGVPERDAELATLAREALRALERDAPPLEALRRVGCPEPEAQAAAIRELHAEPALRTSRDVWLPALLRSARPGRGAQTLQELAQRYRSLRGADLDVALHPTLPLVLGSSDFLGRLLLRHPCWVDTLAGALPAAPATEVLEPDWSSLRRAKYRGLVRICARDLCRRPFEQSLSELSDLADTILTSAVPAACPEPGLGPPALFALGKLGASELNFSSDVDLLFVRAAATEEDAEPLERWVRGLKRELERPTEDGFAYRVDLDLRPLGTIGPLTNTLDAALLYYETRGAEWERQMLIRLRGVSGPPALRQAFAQGLVPFIYRRAIDFGAVERVRAMKLRIESERRESGRDLEWDLKEGPGGIRDVEFFVQALQLFHGGQLPELRTGNTLSALGVLAERGLLPVEVAESLRVAYLWLRRAEHALQMVEERQVHVAPQDPAGQLALARRMAYRHVDGREVRTAFLEDWSRIRAAVRQHFDALVLREPRG